jgi:two-component system LytT family sensor kinase
MAVQMYSLKRILPLYIGWWLFWAIIHVLVLHRLGIHWKIGVLDSGISNALLAIVCSIALTIYKFYQPGAGNRFYRLLHGIGITALYMVIIHWLFRFVFCDNPSYLAFLDLSMPVRFMFSLLMVSFVTLLNWLWNNLQELKDQENRKAEAEQLVKDAELVKLRQQLQPHFLFNSLNSISALAGSKPDEARRMIQQLSDFLRGTLRKDEQQTVVLSEELEHLKLYLDIEKVRFGHRLHVALEINKESENLYMPPLLLQPIVENAIKFGLYGTIDSITVSIKTWLENAYLVVEIKNPFDEETQNVKQGTGFGLSSIQRRLFLLYARADLIATEKKDNIFITRLKIPQLK